MAAVDFQSSETGKRSAPQRNGIAGDRTEGSAAPLSGRASDALGESDRPTSPGDTKAGGEPGPPPRGAAEAGRAEAVGGHAPVPGPDALVCRRCLEPRDPEELDRQLWCEACRAAARRTASNWGRLIGLALAAALAIWVGLVVGPSDMLLVLWAAVIIFAYRILSRLGQELIFGIIRIRNRPLNG